MNMRPLVELGWDYRGSGGKKQSRCKVPKLSVKDDISEVLVSRTGNGSDWNDGIIHINTLEWQKILWTFDSNGFITEQFDPLRSLSAMLSSQVKF